MKVKDIVKECGKLLQYDFDSDLFEDAADADFVRQTLASDKKLNMLTECVVAVEKELACDYFPLIFSQTFESATAKYCDFKKTLHEVLSVVDKHGNSVAFCYSPTEVRADTDGEITVKYSFCPAKKGFDDVLEVGSPKIDERLFTFGALTEYFFLTAMYDEAAIWEKRYKDLVQIAAYQNKPQKIKGRRWI